MLLLPLSSPSMPVGVASAAAAPAAPSRRPFTPTQLRVALIGSALAAVVLGYLVTNGEPASRAAIAAGAELTRLLRMMTLLKVTLGAGALALVSLRLRFPISMPLAGGYIVAGCVMAAGPGVMWNMAHIGFGALLLHGGLAALFCLGWIDGGTLPRRRRLVRAT